MSFNTRNAAVFTPINDMFIQYYCISAPIVANNKYYEIICRKM